MCWKTNLSPWCLLFFREGYLVTKEPEGFDCLCGSDHQVGFNRMRHLVRIKNTLKVKCTLNNASAITLNTCGTEISQSVLLALNPLPSYHLGPLSTCERNPGLTLAHLRNSHLHQKEELRRQQSHDRSKSQRMTRPSRSPEQETSKRNIIARRVLTPARTPSAPRRRASSVKR